LDCYEIIMIWCSYYPFLWSKWYYSWDSIWTNFK